MTTLVVQAHPVAESYNAAVRDAIVARLQNEGDTPRVLSLGQGDLLTPGSLLDVTSLIAVYPTWWGSVPAMLLAQLGELIGPWVDGDELGDTSPLRRVSALKVVTSHGSSQLVNRLQGEPGRQLWKRTVLPLCAPGATFTWKPLYKMDRLTESDRREFLRRA